MQDCPLEQVPIDPLSHDGTRGANRASSWHTSSARRPQRFAILLETYEGRCDSRLSDPSGRSSQSDDQGVARHQAEHASPSQSHDGAHAILTGDADRSGHTLFLRRRHCDIRPPRRAAVTALDTPLPIRARHDSTLGHTTTAEREAWRDLSGATRDLLQGGTTIVPGRTNLVNTGLAGLHRKCTLNLGLRPRRRKRT